MMVGREATRWKGRGVGMDVGLGKTSVARGRIEASWPPRLVGLRAPRYHMGEVLAFQFQFQQKLT